MKKVYLVAILIICMIVFVPLNVQAAEEFDPSELISSNNYDPNAHGQVPDEFADFAGKILAALTTIGVIVLAVVLAIIGFTYITGSAGDIAELKSKFGGILIGAVLLTSATTIVRLMLNIL